MKRYFQYFHKLTADHIAGRTHVPMPPPEEWPQEWTNIDLKTYAGTPVVELDDGGTRSADLFRMISGRRSVRGGHKNGLSREDLSLILRYSCGMQEMIRSDYKVKLRAQPSGGARFPLEVYVVSLGGENEVGQGVYHYNVKAHTLEQLRRRTFSGDEIQGLFTYPWAKECSAALVITAQFERSAVKYGERAYRYALIEAGHIGQGVYLIGEAIGVGVTGMGGTRDEAIHRLIGIDGSTETLVYALMLSK